MTSEGEELLAFQLKAAKIEFVREYRFASPRKWRFDFVIKHGDDLRLRRVTPFLLAVEIEGGAFSGGHRRGKEADKDCEKANVATLRGWRVLRFTPAMVKDGRALAMIEQALGR
jgi:hypothetical protein